MLPEYEVWAIITNAGCLWNRIIDLAQTQLHDLYSATSTARESPTLLMYSINQTLTRAYSSYPLPPNKRVNMFS